MKIIEKKVKTIELTEEDLCKLYLEIRERIQEFKPIEAFPTIHKFYGFLHKFEGKSFDYEKEVYGRIESYGGNNPK